MLLGGRFSLFLSALTRMVFMSVVPSVTALGKTRLCWSIVKRRPSSTPRLRYGIGITMVPCKLVIGALLDSAGAY